MIDLQQSHTASRSMQRLGSKHPVIIPKTFVTTLDHVFPYDFFFFGFIFGVLRVLYFNWGVLLITANSLSFIYTPGASRINLVKNKHYPWGYWLNFYIRVELEEFLMILNLSDFMNASELNIKYIASDQGVCVSVLWYICLWFRDRLCIKKNLISCLQILASKTDLQPENCT